MQMMCSGWLKGNSHCVCRAHQNTVLLVNAMDWDLTYKDLIKIFCNPDSNECKLALQGSN